MPLFPKAEFKYDYQEATDGDYLAIDVDDTAEWKTDDPSLNDKMVVWFIMDIEETPADITEIEFTFNGNTDSANTTHKMYVLKAGEAWETDASWTELTPSLVITKDVDTDFTRSLTSNITDYDSFYGCATWRKLVNHRVIHIRISCHC